MRIALLTSCLEPGKDGVGDYSRDLAAACRAAGHETTLLALNDHHVGAAARQEPQCARGIAIDTLRLSAAATWEQRAHEAAAWLDARDVDWVSLQFVPYGYHAKGMVHGLERHLRALARSRPVHVMFHETWIGAELEASMRQRLVGRVQRAGVLRLVRGIQPTLVHTSNPAYRALLGAASVPAHLLPLWGNVPVVRDAPGWLAEQLLRAGIAPKAERKYTWCFGLFGSLHGAWRAEPLFAHLAAAARQHDRRVVIASIGRQGAAGAVLWKTIAQRYARQFSFCAFGERPAEEVSWFLQELDYGIATTPWQVIGKSGTVAAMLEHGVPVIVSRDDVSFAESTPTPTPCEPLLYRMDDDLPRWLAATHRASPRERLPALAAQFLRDLASCAVQAA